MKYKLTFRIPPQAKQVKRLFDGEEYSYQTFAGAPARAEIKVKALDKRQAFVIGQSIAKRNGWAMSSEPIKMEF